MTSTVHIRTRHLFGLGCVRGRIAVRSAELVVTDPPTGTTLRAVLDAASFDSGTPQRDAAVRSAAYLDTATYPDITFTCADVSRAGDTWVASGTVTAHGVAAPVHVTLETCAQTSSEVTLRAHAKIDRYAHRVVAGKGFAARRLTVDIVAVAVPS